ncbi:MAG: Mov34/MPN/PAD-1 family protein [Chloroflexota bacterium]
MFPILEAGPSLEGATLPAFVVARDGLYLRKRSLLGLSQTKVGRIAHLPEGREFLDYALPKVPQDLMARAVGFFRAVYRLHRTEAAVLLLWRDGSFDLAVPDQKVSSVSVKFDVPDGELPAGSRLVGTMHSHGGFTAYASSTDEDDEAELDGLHIVIGDFDRRRLGYSAAIVVDGIRFHLKTGQLIERPRRLVEPPDDWLRKVKLAPPPRRSKGKPSISEYVARGFKPSDEISKPSRRELEDALDRAGKMATALGYRLSHWLVPVSPPVGPEGRADG